MIESFGKYYPSWRYILDKNSGPSGKNKVSIKEFHLYAINGDFYTLSYDDALIFMQSSVNLLSLPKEARTEEDVNAADYRSYLKK